MSLFGNKERQTISRLESELERKNRRISQLDLCALRRMNTSWERYLMDSGMAAQRLEGIWLTERNTFTGSIE